MTTTYRVFHISCKPISQLLLGQLIFEIDLLSLEMYDLFIRSYNFVTPKFEVTAFVTSTTEKSYKVGIKVTSL